MSGYEPTNATPAVLDWGNGVLQHGAEKLIEIQVVGLDGSLV